MNKFKKLVLDDFCLRQFNKGVVSSIDMDPNIFLNKVNNLYNPNNLKDGYAPFCKHIFIENFTNNESYYTEINENTEQFIKTNYEKRTDKELAVLRRYIPKDKIKQSKGKYLDIILYSKKQISQEKIQMNEIDNNKDLDYDWGIISVKIQDINYEIPMDPITIMRNELGLNHGGSGIKINKQSYEKSIDFWSKNIILK